MVPVNMPKPPPMPEFPLAAHRIVSVNGQLTMGMRAVEVQAMYSQAKAAGAFTVVFEK